MHIPETSGVKVRLSYKNRRLYLHKKDSKILRQILGNSCVTTETPV